MAFCSSCGAQVDDGTAYCPKCGNRVSAAGAPASAAGNPTPPGPVAPAPAQSPIQGMAENVAGMLCYIFGWVTGIIFLLIDKRPFVRFHAGQSIVVFGALHVLYFILGRIFFVSVAVGSAVGFGLGSLLFDVLWIGSIVLGIFLMVKAYQGERYRLPLAGDYADSLAGKVKT
jgi:uncharacterized membrane protein